MATFDSSTVGSDVAPSYSPKLSINNDVIRVDMGDGYEQRLKRGINSTRRTYTLNFLNARTNTVTTNILNFLADLLLAVIMEQKLLIGLLHLVLQVNGFVKILQVTMVSHNLNDIELEFVEVFEP